MWLIAAFLAMRHCHDARSGLKVVLKSLKPLLFIIILTALLNLFYGQRGADCAVLDLQNHKSRHSERRFHGRFALSLLVAGTFMLTYHHLADRADGRAGKPAVSRLRRLHAPVHELSMMMSIALRFIPTLIEETDKIMSAQKAQRRGF